jgi:hypothetical protein
MRRELPIRVVSERMKMFAILVILLGAPVDAGRRQEFQPSQSAVAR